ncbi:hypothetical protein [Pedobacter lusitanus]|nr:hypothetical protein [Pedobacter lusitanus]
MKTLSVFSLLILSAVLTSAVPRKLANPVKERMNEVAAVPVRYSKAIRLVLMRRLSSLPTGMPLPGGVLKNLNTGEIVGGDGSSPLLINVNIGDVVSGEYNYQDGRQLKGNLTITADYYERGSGSLWVR